MFIKFNLQYSKNNLFSILQFNHHLYIYDKSVNLLNNFLLKNNIVVKNKFELIDIINDVPEPNKSVFINVLGNYLNHDYYFKNISFNKTILFGNIKILIIKTFNSFENFEKIFIKNFLNHLGWGWLIINNNKICFLKTKDNINPLFSISNGGFNSIPIICIDLHEHSYIFDYKNKLNYLNNILNYLNWYEIENRLQNYFLNK